MIRTHKYKSLNHVDYPLIILSNRSRLIFANNLFYHLKTDLLKTDTVKTVPVGTRIEDFLALKESEYKIIYAYFQENIVPEQSRPLLVELQRHNYILQISLVEKKRFLIAFKKWENFQDLTPDKTYLQSKSIDEKNELFDVFNSIDDLIHITDDRYAILYMNTAMKKIYGDAVGKFCYTVFNKTQSPCVSCKMKYIQKGISIRYELRNDEKDIYYDVVNSPYLQPDGRLFKVSIMRDITTMRNDQERLRIFMNAIDNATNSIAICNKNGAITYANNAMSNLFNIPKNDIIGKDLYNMYKLDPEVGDHHEIDLSIDNRKLSFLLSMHPVVDDNNSTTAYISIAQDITQTRNLEKQFERDRGYFKKIIDDSIDGFFVIDKEFRILDYNRSFLKTFNITDDYKRLNKKVKETLNEIPSKKIKSVFRQKKSETAEIIIRKNKSVKHFLISLNPLQNENNEVTGIYGFLKNITEIKRLQYLIENEKNYNRSIIETVTLGFVLVDDENRYLDYNKAYLDILGRDEGELLNKTFYDFTADPFIDEQKNIMKELIKTSRSVIFEKEIIRNDGDRVPVLVTMSRLIDNAGNAIGSFAFIKDISDQKRSEQKLIEENIRILDLVNIYNNISAQFLNAEAIDDVFRELYNSIMLISSPDAVEIFKGEENGFRSVYYHNRLSMEKDIIIDSRLSLTVARILSAKNPIYIKDTRTELNEEDSDLFPGLFHDNSSAIFIPIVIKNAVIGIIILAFKKELKKFDTILLNILMGISNLAFISIDKINSLQEQIDMKTAFDRYERLTAMGRIAAGVAHEINNPLSIMLLDVDELKTYFDENIANNNFSGEINSSLISLREEIKRMSGIIAQLKEYSKLDKIDNEKIHVDEIFKVYPIKILLKNLRKKGIEIRLNLTTGKELVLISRNQLIQVIMNLITNADDAIQNKQSGLIEISTRKIEKKQRIIVISIKDNGIGVSKTNINNIFEPFFTTKTSEGTGLGLSVSYTIITGYNGEIKVTSELDKGSNFEIYLPEYKETVEIQ